MKIVIDNQNDVVTVTKEDNGSSEKILEVEKGEKAEVVISSVYAIYGYKVT